MNNEQKKWDGAGQPVWPPKMDNTAGVKLISNTSGDWTVAKLDGEVFYQGHDGYSELLENLLWELNIPLTREEISDEEMEKL